VFYLIIIRFIPFLYKNNFLTNFINCLLFVSPKIFKFGNFAFFSFFSSFLSLPFLFFSLSSCFLLTYSREHVQHTPNREQASSSSSEAASLAPLLQPSLSPCRPKPCPLSSPLLPLSSELPMAPHGSSNSGHGCPPKESLTQSSFSSWDDQNGCTWPPSCYPHTQFYLKRTLISEFWGISFLI
jgi:hypothetical protein